MPFFHVQGIASPLNTTPATSTQVTMAAPPTKGNLVIVSVIFADDITPATATLQDGNGNVYTQTPNSPSVVQYLSSGALYSFYLLSAPANASAILTASFNRTFLVALIAVEEFSYTGGTCVFDKDAAGSGTTGSLNTPSIAPTNNAGELLFSYATPEHGIPTVNAPWTPVAFGEDADGGNGGYILSSNPGSTAVNMTTSDGTSGWDSLALAFMLVPPIFMLAR